MLVICSVFFLFCGAFWIERVVLLFVDCLDVCWGILGGIDFLDINGIFNFMSSFQ